MKRPPRYLAEPLERRMLLAATLVKDIFAGGNSSPSFLANFSDVLFFNALSTSGARLWRTDGTDPGTTIVSSIIPSNTTPVEVALTYGTDKVKNVLFFAANALGGGEELFMIDGTGGTPTRVLDIRPGAAGSLPR
ncbi:MAG: hypothetical protein ACREJC_17795, partial [Tepidisphaeraceae bacterium]